MAGERQPRWSVEVSIRATPEELAQHIEWIEHLDPTVTVDVRGPSEIGVCLVTVKGRLAVNDDGDSMFRACERDHPDSIVMGFKD